MQWVRGAGGLVCVKLGHFLHIDPYALAVEQHEVDRLDGRRHGVNKVAGYGFQNELGSRLLREAIPSTTNRREGHRLELLLVSQGQAVLHGLIQQLLTLVRTPAWTVAVDHKLGRKPIARRQHR